MSVFIFLPVSVRLEAVQQLAVETVSEGSVRVRWRGVSGARAYRLVWGPFTGQDKADIKQHLAYLTVKEFGYKYIFFFVFLFTKVEMLRLWRLPVTASFTLCPACSPTPNTSSLSSRCMRATLRAL